jgi:uncharacterized GH25 family protein
MKKLLALAVLLCAAGGAASAHTAYLMPSDFIAPNDRVRFESAYATTFFTPEVALAAGFKVIQPDGTEGAFDQAEITSNATRLASFLNGSGTYRITSGEQLGVVATLVGVDGAWRPLAPGETPPPDAQTTTLQTVTLADAYVTRGTPSRGPVDAQASALAIKPVTHPNQVVASQGFQVQVLLNGAPFANTPVVLYASGQADTDTTRYFVTDANGVATVALDQPGNYVIAVRYRGAAPAGSPAAIRSYTTTLTFQALAQAPTFTPLPDEGRPRRGHRGMSQ